MSRFENKPVAFPDKVEVSLEGRTLRAKGERGENVFAIPRGVTIDLQAKAIAYAAETKEDRAMVGLCYRLTKNLFSGVHIGFRKDLEVKGVGYRWSVSGRTLKLQLGFSNDIFCELPESLAIEIDKDNTLSVVGNDKQKVGAFAAKIRAYRSVEPYKGKGIRYKGEVVIKKVGKSGKAAG